MEDIRLGQEEAGMEQAYRRTLNIIKMKVSLHYVYQIADCV